MKLYATTTSERASKGQGGNEYIDIDVFDKHQNLLARFVFMENEDKQDGNEYLLVKDNAVGVGNITISEGFGYKRKGKRQKGEHTHKWNYAGMCEGEEGPNKCGRKTYVCLCGAYKDCDGGVN